MTGAPPTDLPLAMRLAAPDAPATPLHPVFSDGLDAALAAQPPAVRAWIAATGFGAAAGEAAAAPDAQGGVAVAFAGLGERAPAPTGFTLAGAVDRLPPGVYRLTGAAGLDVAGESLGWLLHNYRFDRYRSGPAPSRRLAAPEGVDAARVETLAAGVALGRDLVNTPANDLGPAGLEAAATVLADAHGAVLTVTRDAALAAGFPLIAAVGRAASSDAAPRLIELRWGRADAPRVTLVGKGVCFDTGGLDLKPASAMRLMKKDMGGAAAALAAAAMIMGTGLDVALRVLIPAVENAVAGDAFRPGDVLRSRKGLTVEIGNTDAEGRLVLADALTLACEDDPGWLIDFATLTGAARVALGPDLPALFSDDEALAAALATAGARVRDPLWRLPLWSGYDAMLKSPVADLDNAPSGGFAGAVTAALFLRRFVPKGVSWAHVDLYAWNPKAAPGRPAGGETQAARAVVEALTARHG